MDPTLIPVWVITLSGFVLGALFGAIASRTHFCALGSISDALNIGSWARARMWVIAVSTAVLGVWALDTGGWVDTRLSVYANTRLPVLSIILGGLMFGAGMVLASGCTSKTLIRLGSGNLKSLVVVLVLGLSAYMTLRGIFAVWRVATIDRVTIDFGVAQTLPALLTRLLELPAERVEHWSAPLIGLVGLGLALKSRELWRHERSAIAGGLAIGMVIAAGWWVTGWLAYVPEHPDTLELAFIATQLNRPESLSLVAPYAYTIELLTLWSDQSRKLTFGIASALGMVSGSLLYALATGQFRQEIFPDAQDFRRHLAGAVLMGVGGVLALGCTVGQGLSGLSVLSMGALLATGAMITGAVAMIKLDERRLSRVDS
jgi:uncharacterized membrane protein YedE/YeeE